MTVTSAPASRNAHGRHLARCSVGASSDDVQAVQPVGQDSPAGGGHSGPAGVVELDASGRRRHRSGAPRLVHPCLDGVLDRRHRACVRRREELDPVVGHRVVRGRQHDPEVSIQVGGEEGHCWGGQQPGVHDVDTQRTPDPATTAADRNSPEARPIAPDHRELGRCPANSPGITPQHVRGRHRQVEGQLCRDVDIGQAAHTIGAEESSHERPFVGDRQNLPTRMNARRRAPTRGVHTRQPTCLRLIRPPDARRARVAPGRVGVRDISACCTAEPCGPS
jgi:hypothetical protein